MLQGREGDNFVCRICHLIKQSLDEFIARETVMRGYANERAQPERVVIVDGDVMLATNGASQPQMAARLACDAASHSLKAFDQIPHRRDHAALSCRQHFFTGDVQADQVGQFSFVKVAMHSVANLGVQAR